MGIRYRSDGELDMRTTAGKLSGGGGGKRGCIWGLISGFFMFIFYFYYYIFVFSYKILCYIYKKGRILYGEIRTYYLNKKERR